jgi:hypothetical protein
LIEKAVWVLSKIKKYGSAPKVEIRKFTYWDYYKSRYKAKALARERVAFFNALYKHKVGEIDVRNQKTRWGSCSAKGNLTFNFKILFLPPRARDYIIVHEICHLKEFNHSQKFWDLVAKTIPDYKAIRRAIRSQEILLD